MLNNKFKLSIAAIAAALLLIVVNESMVASAEPFVSAKVGCGLEYRANFGCPVVVDNFDGSAFNKNWIIYDYPSEVPPRVASNVSVNNGNAEIIGTYDQATGTILGGGVKHKVSQKYGRWETRMRIERGKGWSGVGLLWPTSENWPTEGEINLWEIPKAPRQVVWHILHNGPNNSKTSAISNADATQWHTYAVEWTKGRITIYVDNKVVLTSINPKYIPTLGKMHFVMQMDAGVKQNCGAPYKNWFECPDSSTPAKSTMYLDYVKVWNHPTTIK